MQPQLSTVAALPSRVGIVDACEPPPATPPLAAVAAVRVSVVVDVPRIARAFAGIACKLHLIATKRCAAGGGIGGW